MSVDPAFLSAPSSPHSEPVDFPRTKSDINPSLKSAVPTETSLEGDTLSLQAWTDGHLEEDSSQPEAAGRNDPQVVIAGSTQDFSLSFPDISTSPPYASVARQDATLDLLTFEGDGAVEPSLLRRRSQSQPPELLGQQPPLLSPSSKPLSPLRYAAVAGAAMRRGAGADAALASKYARMATSAYQQHARAARRFHPYLAPTSSPVALTAPSRRFQRASERRAAGQQNSTSGYGGDTVQRLGCGSPQPDSGLDPIPDSTSDLESYEFKLYHDQTSLALGLRTQLAGLRQSCTAMHAFLDAAFAPGGGECGPGNERRIAVESARLQARQRNRRLADLDDRLSGLPIHDPELRDVSAPETGRHVRDLRTHGAVDALLDAFDVCYKPNMFLWEKKAIWLRFIGVSRGLMHKVLD